MQMFLMPHAYQIQRKIKLALSGKSFDIQLRERLEEVARESIINNGTKLKQKQYNKIIIDLIIHTCIQYNAVLYLSLLMFI